MKFSDYKRRLESDPDYTKARAELALKFELANSILRARIVRGLSQKELADKVGTKQANISRIEAGLANPTLSLIQKIFKALGLEIKILPQTVSFEARVNTANVVTTERPVLIDNWPGTGCSLDYDTKSSSASQWKEQNE